MGIELGAESFGSVAPKLTTCTVLSLMIIRHMERIVALHETYVLLVIAL